MGEPNSNSNSLKYLLDIAENYGVSHKHLVQLIIKHGILQTHYFCNKFVQYVQVYSAGDNIITQLDDGQEKILIEKLITVINNALVPLSLRLIQTDDEYDDKNSYIVLLSDQRPSDFLRDAFGLTQTEITLFHLWISAICNSENGEILKHEALSIASDLLVKGKKVDEEDLLQQFVSNKWLIMDNVNATIRLGARGIAELQNYFSSHANEFKLEKCIVCGKFIVMKNHAVFCETCRSFSHRQCGLKIIKSVRTGKVLCPGKLANDESCTAELHISTERDSMKHDQKGNRKRRIANDFEEQDGYDIDSTEKLHDAEIYYAGLLAMIEGIKVSRLRTVMDSEEVDLETPAGTLADSLAQIFMMTTRVELRQQAYQMVGVENNRDFALAVEARLNEYFQSKQRKLDRRSILQIREEKDDASVILEHFLKTAGLPPDAVEKFSSKNLYARIKKLEETVNQRSLVKSYLVEMKNDGLSNIPGYQDLSNYNRKELGFVEAVPSIIDDEFSASSEDEVSDIFLIKRRKSVSLSRSRSFPFSDHKYVLQAETDVDNVIGKKNDLKPCHNSVNFDEFSDFSDEFENESLSKTNTPKANIEHQFSSPVDDEFSSSDETAFSPTNDTDFPLSRKELIQYQ